MTGNTFPAATGRTTTQMSPTLKTSSESRHETRKGLSWWMEMAMVDFRNALWPWLVYVVFISGLIPQTDTPSMLITVQIASCSAFLVRIFSTDFAHGTASTLLTFPRKRSSIWLCRLVTAAILTLVPLFVFYGTEIEFRALIGLLAIGYLSTSAMLALLLRRPLLTWSSTFIMPFVFIILYAMIPGVPQDSSILNHFPYIPITILAFNLLGYTIFLFAAWRLWLRLEVRS